MYYILFLTIDNRDSKFRYGIGIGMTHNFQSNLVHDRDVTENSTDIINAISFCHQYTYALHR